MGLVAGEQQTQGQHNPPQAQLAAIGKVPFRGRMRPPALPPRSDRHRRQAERKRNIGVGRGAIQMASDPQVGVYRAHTLKDGGVMRQRSARPRTDLLHARSRPAAVAPRIFRFYRLFDRGF